MIWYAKYYVNEKGVGLSMRLFKIKKGRIICKSTGKDCGELRSTK